MFEHHAFYLYLRIDWHSFIDVNFFLIANKMLTNLHLLHMRLLKSIILFLAAAGLSFGSAAQEIKIQEDTASAELPYKKYPTLPAFNILEMDSTTIFNTFNIPKGHYVALMAFDPDCHHCKDFTRKLTAEMDSLKNINFYLCTPVHDISAIKKFYDDFHLGDFKNIKVVGRDYEFFYHDFYKVKFVPDIALYDKDKNLIKLFEANATVKDLYDYTH
jgi:hypothetical protein